MEVKASSVTTTITPSNKVKSASRLAQLTTNNNVEFDCESENSEIPHYNVEYAPSISPQSNRKSALIASSKHSINKTRDFLVNLSASPVRKSKTRLLDRLDVNDDQSSEYRRKCKSRSSGNGFSGCGSPRVLRRPRRRIENDDKEIVGLDEVIKPRKSRINAKSNKEKTNSSVLSKENEGEIRLEHVRLMIWDLIMWRDVAKSSLWFGFGCLCFLSSCFTKSLHFSLFSLISQLGLVFLAVSFISNTLHHRENVPKTRELCVKEDDIVRVVRVILPALNLIISKARELFSGEPSMTLKVAAFFLFGADYGHLLTVWRLCVLGFFTSFTAPKLYSSYAAQIDNKAHQYKSIVLEAWRSCYHKKIVVATAATIFWNLSCLKTRVFAAFISLVILRYNRQHSTSKMEEFIPGEENPKQQQNLAKVEEQAKETHEALAVSSEKSDK